MNERTGGGGGAADERTIDRQTDWQKPNGQEMIDNEVGGDGDESVRKGGEGRGWETILSNRRNDTWRMFSPMQENKS